MKKLRELLLKLAVKTGNHVLLTLEGFQDDGRTDRYYAEMKDGLRLYFEDGEYVGFSTQEPNREG